jgi:hypothetical protein
LFALHGFALHGFALHSKPHPENSKNCPAPQDGTGVPFPKYRRY